MSWKNRLAGFLVWSSCVGITWAQDFVPIPLGFDFQVNSYTTSFQSEPGIITQPNGDFVIVWHSNGSSYTDTSGVGILGQHFSSNGTPSGTEFQINSYTTNAQRTPSSSFESDGNFVVVWASTGSSGTDTGYSIQGQRYSSSGSAIGTEFQINSFTTGVQRVPAVSMGLSGEFVVAWEENSGVGSVNSIGRI